MIFPTKPLMGRRIGVRRMSVLALTAVIGATLFPVGAYAQFLNPADAQTTWILPGVAGYDGTSSFFNSANWSAGVPASDATEAIFDLNPSLGQQVLFLGDYNQGYGANSHFAAGVARFDILDFQSGKVLFNLGSNVSGGASGSLTIAHALNDYGSVYVGDTSSNASILTPSASLSVVGGSVASSDILVGNNGVAGTLDLGSGTTWNVYGGYDPLLNVPPTTMPPNVNSGGLFLGLTADGVVNVHDGATIHFNLPAVGYNYLSTGGSWNGVNTESTVNVTTGGQFVNDGFMVLGGAGDRSTFNVNGANSLFGNHGQLWIGAGAAGLSSLTVDGGAAFDSSQLAGAPASTVYIGWGSEGIVNIGSSFGAGHWNMAGSVGDANIGEGSVGTLNVGFGSDVWLQNVDVGVATEGMGIVNLGDASYVGTALNAGELVVGDQGNGTVNVRNANLTIADGLVVGNAGFDNSSGNVWAGTGTLSLSGNGGMSALLSVGNGILVGNGGSGSVAQTGGSVATVGSLSVGETVVFTQTDQDGNVVGYVPAAGWGDYNLSGASVLLAGDVRIGDSASGSLEITGSQLSATSLTLGGSAFNPSDQTQPFLGQGVVTVTGDSTLPAVLDVSNGTITVGASSAGNSLTATGATAPSDAAISAFELMVGQDPGAKGQVDLQMALLSIGESLTVGGQGQGELDAVSGSLVRSSGPGFKFTVGDAGTGTVNVNTGSQVFAGDIVVGNQYGSTGSFTVGDSSYLGTSLGGSSLTVGNVGAGSLTIDNAVTKISGDVSVGGATLLVDLSGNPWVAAGNGVVNISGLSGGLPTLAVGGLTIVGNGGTGVVNQVDDGSGSSVVNLSGLRIGDTVEFPTTDSNGNPITLQGNGQGAWTVSSGGVLNVAGANGNGLVVGGTAQGALTINNSTVTVTTSPAEAYDPFVILGGSLNPSPLGADAYGNGTVSLTGSGSAPALLDVTGGSIIVGAGGTGFLRADGGDSSAGATIRTGSLILGQNTSAMVGTVNLRSATLDANLGANNTGFIVVGSDGVGYLNATNQSDIETGGLIVGEHASWNTGSTLYNLHLTDSTLIATSYVSIGRGGAGRALLEQASTLSTQVLAIGEEELTSGYSVTTGSGTLMVDASAVNVGAAGGASNAFLAVGRQGYGELDLTNGSKLTIGANSFQGSADMVSGVVADSAGGKGVISLSDGAGGIGSTMTLLAGDLYVGSSGVGTLSAANSSISVQSKLDSSSVSWGGNLDLGGNAGASGTLNLTRGATLYVQQTTTVGDGGIGVLNVSGGSHATLTGDVTVGAWAGANGSVVVSDAGSRIDAGGNVFNGASGQGQVSMGDGSVFHLIGTFNNGTLGTLKGKGTLDAAALVNDGLVEPGGSPGVLTVNGAYAQNSDGILGIYLDGTTAGSGYSQLAVNGAATLDGTLAITLGPDYVYSRGQTFWLMLYGSHTGMFALDDLNGNPLDTSKWTLTYTPVGLELATQPVPEPGSLAALGFGLAGLLVARRRR